MSILRAPSTWAELITRGSSFPKRASCDFRLMVTKWKHLSSCKLPTRWVYCLLTPSITSHYFHHISPHFTILLVLQPLQELDWQAAYKHEYQTGVFEAQVVLRYDPQWKVVADLMYKNLPGDFMVKGRLELPQGLNFYVHEKVTLTGSSHYRHHFLATFDAGYVMSRVEVPGSYKVVDGVHEVEGRMVVNNYPPLEIRGAFRPEWRRPKLEVVVVYEETEYGLKGNFELGNTEEEQLIKGTLVLYYPNQQSSFWLLLQRSAEGRLSLQTSLELTPAINITLSSHLLLSFVKPEFKVFVTWPSNHASLFLTAGQQHSNGMVWEATGRMESSLEGLEVMAVRASVQLSHLVYSTTLKITLPGDENTIEASVKLMPMDYSLLMKLLMPFEEGTELLFYTTTDMTGTSLQHKTTFKCNHHYVLATLEVQQSPPLLFQGGFHVDSSYPSLNGISAKTSLEVNQGSDVELTVELPGERKFTVLGTFNTSLREGRSIASYSLDTTFLPIPKQQLSWELQWHEGGYDGWLNVSLLEDHFHLTSEGLLRREEYGFRNALFNFKSESSLNYLDAVHCSVNHTEDSTSHRTSTLVDGQYGSSYKGHFHQTLIFLRGSHLILDLDAALSGHLNYNFTLNTDNVITDDSCRSTSKFFATGLGGGVVTQETTYKGPSDFTFALNATSLQRQLLLLRFRNLKEHETWVNRGVLEYLGEEQLNWNTSFNSNIDSKHFHVVLESSFNHAKHVEVDGTFERGVDFYNFQGHVQHHLLPDNISVELHLAARNRSFVTFNATLTSPLETVKLFNVDAFFKHYPSAHKYVVSGSVQYNDQRSHISSVHIIKSTQSSPRTFNTQSIIELPGYDKNIEMMIIFIGSSSSVEAELKLQTPFDLVQKLACRFDLNGRPSNLNNTISFQYNQHETTQLIHYEYEHALKFQRRVISNSAYIPSSFLDFKASREDEMVNASLLYTDHQGMFTSDFSMDTNNPRRLLFTLTTPYPSFKNVSCDLKLFSAGHPSSFAWRGHATLRINEKVHNGDVVLTISQDTVLLNATIDYSQPIRLLLHKQGSWEDLKADVKVFVGHSFVEGDLQLHYSVESFKRLGTARLTLESSFEGFEKSHVEVKGEASHHSSTIAVEMRLPVPSYEDFKLKVESFGDQRDYTALVTFTTPFSAMRQSLLTLKYSNREHNYRVFSSLDVKGDEHILLTLNTALPFNNHNAEYQVKCSFDIPSLPGTSYILLLTSKATPGSIDARGLVTTPMEGHERYEVDFKHRFSRGDVLTRAHVFVRHKDVPTVQLSVTGTLQSVQDFDLTLQLLSSVDIGMECRLVFQYWQRFLADISVNFPYPNLEKMQLKAGYSTLSEALDVEMKVLFLVFSQTYSSELVLKYLNGLKVLYSYQTPEEFFGSLKAGITGLRSDKMLELGVETAASFLPLPELKVHHLFEKDLSSFHLKNELHFVRNQHVTNFSMRSRYSNIRRNNRIFQLDLGASLPLFKSLQISHEDIFSFSKGHLVLTYAENKKVDCCCCCCFFVVVSVFLYHLFLLYHLFFCCVIFVVVSFVFVVSFLLYCFCCIISFCCIVFVA